VKVLDAVTGLDLLTLKGHTGSVEHVRFGVDGNKIYSVGVAHPAQGIELKIWDATPRPK
jgi:hypothetical protein